jgi:type IV pilus assembly protein PilB
VISKALALERACVAVALDNDLLTVAMADPLRFSVVQDLELRTGFRVKQVVGARGAIRSAIETCYADEATPAAATDRSIRAETPPEAMPIPDLVTAISNAACEERVTAVHVDPTENDVRVRQRLDGVLEDVMRLPKHVQGDLIARLKAASGMDAAEKRLPQDGRLRAADKNGIEVDFRVSTLRTLFGEKVVLRVLDQRKRAPSLDEIGMSAVALEQLQSMLRRREGMILVVGPAGSGRTTTLGASLRALQPERSNIVTIEETIEYRTPDVNHTQVAHNADRSVASALQSIRSQDADAILVGEIRDGETARMVATAAQSAPLLLSSLRADDAASAVTRLIDLGAESIAIGAALVGAVAQRLVRRLCVHCRREHVPPPDVLRRFGITDAHGATFHEAVGCDQCSHTGYRGRLGIVEVMPVTDTLRQLITAGARGDQLRDAAISDGMISLAEDGLAKVRSGLTSAAELLRVVTELREPRALCSECGRAVGVDFKACPHCGRRIGGACVHCGRALQPGWNFCPYCTQHAARTRAQPRRGKVAEFRKQ